MKYEGTVTINAPQKKAWTLLTDPNLVSQCAPGLKSMEIIQPDKLFKVVAAVGFGAVRLNFVTDVEWVEMQPPDLARVKAHGSAPGSGVDVAASMNLSSTSENVTTLNWVADIVVVGTVASLASRMMSGMVKQLTTSFFNCIKEKIEA